MTHIQLRERKRIPVGQLCLETYKRKSWLPKWVAKLFMRPESPYMDTFEHVTINIDNVRERIFKMRRSVEYDCDTQIGAYLVGYDVFHELDSTRDYGTVKMSGLRGFDRNSLTFAGLEVYLVPWVSGIVMVPKEVIDGPSAPPR